MSSIADREWNYLGIGQVLGAIAGLLTFFGCWIYCVSEYGFLVGVTLGWIPSAIAACVVGAAVTFLWGPVLAIVVIGWMISQQPDYSAAEEAAVVAADAAATDAAATAADAAADAAAAATDAAAAGAQTAGDWAPYYPAPADTGAYVASRGTSDCTDDCSGHEAGYAWAEENGIEDGASCDGNSQSFIEGCEAYAEDNH